MRQQLLQLLEAISDLVWGAPLLLLLLGGGLILLWFSKFLPLTKFVHAIQLVSGKYHHKGEERAEGQITHFQALSNALAATIGLGNIAGVAVAIYQGGPGAIFWMWVAALLGMNTKFFECTLALMYRGHDYRGEVQGGPMYVIQKALHPRFQFLGYFFALCGLVGTMALFQVNQLAAYVHTQHQVEPIFVGITCAILVGYILKGGVKRLAHVTSSLVPLMCVLYVGVSLTIIYLNADRVPEIFARIFSEAFNGRAAMGGALGYGVMEVLKTGIKRASFSNEAGVGTAPMAHSNAKTSEPVSEGLVAMLGPFLDTILVCTMTSLVILTSLPEQGVGGDVNGVLLTLQAFEKSLPGVGGYFLGVAIVLFSVTTMVGMANYNEKCWNFVFRGKRGWREPTFIAVFCLSLVLGSIGSVDEVIHILDISFALMVFPNMLATLWLAPKVKAALKAYVDKYKV